jgi:hypothetical protein
VDSVKARFDVAEILKGKSEYRNYNNEPKYWIDMGIANLQDRYCFNSWGIRQPKSEKYETVSNLPFVTEEFGELLKQSEEQDDTPSCSLAEALEKQDLYINSVLAQMGSSLLWNLFRNGLTENRDFFLI